MRRAVIVWPSLTAMAAQLRVRLAEHGLTLEEVEPDLSPDVVSRIADMACDVVLVADWTPGQQGYGLREFVRDLLRDWAAADGDRILAVVSQQPPGAEVYNWLASRGCFNLASAAGKERFGLEDLVRLMARRYRPTDPEVAALIDPAYAESLRSRSEPSRSEPPTRGNGKASRTDEADSTPRSGTLRRAVVFRHGQGAQNSKAAPETAAAIHPEQTKSCSASSRSVPPAPASQPATDDQSPVQPTEATSASRSSAKHPGRERGSGRIYMVAGYKGGVGRTTAAASLAALLAGQGLRVAAGDLHWEMPNLGAHFGVESVASGPGWEAICTGHVPAGLPNKWGVTVIPAPNGFTCQADALRDGLRLLTREFDAVVLDVPPSPWDTAFRAAAVEADRILVLTSNDPVTVEANTRLVELLAAELGVQMVRVLVVGMAWRETAGGVPVDLVREALGAPATAWAGVVPSDTSRAMQAMAGGMPHSLVEPAAWEPVVQLLTGTVSLRHAGMADISPGKRGEVA